MKPDQFDYYRPVSVQETIEVLSSQPDSQILAGGQSLVPMMNMRLARPSALVDISRIEGLSAIHANGDLRVGTTCRQGDVLRSGVIQQRWPLVTSALKQVGHLATRARGTFGGSIALAEPAAELPAVMLALGASFQVQGTSGIRSVSAEDFFLDHYTTDLADDEMLVEIKVPESSDCYWGFGEVARRHGDYALAGVAVCLRVDPAGLVTAPRVALFGVASRPLRSPPAEERLNGTRLGDRDAADDAGRVALEKVNVADDSFVSATYRQEAAASVVRRAVLEAATNPRGEA